MKITKFDSNSFYHIYNRSIGSELLFVFENDYKYFIEKMNRFLFSFSEIIAYCLLPNHFHLLIKIKDKEDLSARVQCKGYQSGVQKELNIDQALKNFFNSYTRSYNIAHTRYGRLFQHGYKYKEINSDEYLLWLIYYIHRNPVHHKLTIKCQDWNYSSYNEIINEKNKTNSEFVFDLFGDKHEFIDLTSELTLEYNKENLSRKYSKDNIEYE
ncbi:MAG: hypothetical protein K9N05_04600 [Candidatus Marinimicrobia bacterium]|nr:hypothetical protein [Candidatus Neomarinimicrobiota bacterium]